MEKNQTLNGSTIQNQLISELYESPNKSITASSDKQNLKSNMESTLGFEVGLYPVLIEKDFLCKIKKFNNRLSKVLCNSANAVSKISCPHTKSKYPLFFDGYAVSVLERFSEKDFMARVDFCISKNQIKLLEVNSGGSIGGWELDFIQPLIASSLDSLAIPKDIEFKYYSILKALVSYLANRVFALDKPDSNGLIVVFIDGNKTEFTHLVEQKLQHIYESLDIFDGGKILICNDISELGFSTGCPVEFKGKSIDALLFADYNSHSKYHDYCQDSFYNGELVYPDNIANLLLGHKSYMALLHEPAMLDVLSNTDCDWIKEFIPRTTLLSDVKSSSDNVQFTTKKYILRNKSEFVLKKDKSLQGKDVIIGKDTEQSKWCTIVERLLQQQGWIVQKFCIPDYITITDKEGIIISAIPVWASFNFAGSFGGFFARTIGSDARGHKVNAADGANLNLVFEAQYL